MSRGRIAFAPEEPLLLTFDGELLLAFDAVTLGPKWSLELATRIHTVLFACRHALPRTHAGSPWRAPSSDREALVIDVAGGIHAIDASGYEVGTVAPVGAPVAVAASTLGGLAIALSDRVLLWHDGVRYELGFRATALAFSGDGRTLALGHGKELREVEVATRTSSGPGRPRRGVIRAIAPRREGEWVVATDVGVEHVVGDEHEALAIKAGTSLAMSARGELLSVQHAVDRVTVYEWPAAAITRIEMAGRTISGLALEGDRLAVAVSGGDANVVDLTRRRHLATKEHAGRTSRPWSLTVDSETRASARSEGAARYGLGAMLTFAVILVCMGYLSSAHQSWVPPPPFLVTETCDASCELARMRAVRVSCGLETTIDCLADADEAMAALETNACDEARAALGRVRSRLGARDDGGHARFSAQLAAAESGLSSCRAETRVVTDK